MKVFVVLWQQVYGDDEWSFGFCEGGDTGVFRCPAGKNTMYKYRKSFVLGDTNFNFFQVIEMLTQLSREWRGDSYDPLSKNCNHFCDEFCARLGVEKLPGKCYPHVNSWWLCKYIFLLSLFILFILIVYFDDRLGW